MHRGAVASLPNDLPSPPRPPVTAIRTAPICFSSGSSWVGHRLGPPAARRRRHGAAVMCREPPVAPSAASLAGAVDSGTPPIQVPATGRCGRLILLRHGQTDWNAAGRIQGQLDESRLTRTFPRNHTGVRGSVVLWPTPSKGGMAWTRSRVADGLLARV